MEFTALHALDIKILTTLYAMRHPALDAAFSLLTWFGSLWLLAPAATCWSLYSWRRAGWRRALQAPLALAAASLTVRALKAAFQRPRPDLYAPLVSMPGDHAFPSAHAAQAMALAAALTWQAPPAWRIGVLATVLAVAVSRPYLQVHFPSDVLAGLLLGVFCAALARYLLPTGAQN